MSIDAKNIKKIERRVGTRYHMHLNQYEKLVFGQNLNPASSTPSGTSGDVVGIWTDIPWNPSYKYVIRFNGPLSEGFSSSNKGAIVTWPCNSPSNAAPRLFCQVRYSGGQCDLRANFVGGLYQQTACKNLENLTGDTDLVIDGHYSEGNVVVYMWDVTNNQFAGTDGQYCVFSKSNIDTSTYPVNDMVIGPTGFNVQYSPDNANYNDVQEALKANIKFVKVYDASDNLIYEMYPSERDYRQLPEYGGTALPAGYNSCGLYDVLHDKQYFGVNAYTDEDNSTNYAAYLAADTLVNDSRNWYAYSPFHGTTVECTAITVNGVQWWPWVNPAGEDMEDLAVDYASDTAWSGWTVPTEVNGSVVSSTAHTNSSGNTYYEATWANGVTGYYMLFDQFSSGNLPSDGKFYDVYYDIPVATAGDYRIICELQSSSSGMNIEFNNYATRYLACDIESRADLTYTSLSLNPQTPTEAGQTAGVPSNVVLGVVHLNGGKEYRLWFRQTSYRIIFNASCKLSLVKM